MGFSLKSTLVWTSVMFAALFGWNEVSYNSEMKKASLTEKNFYTMYCKAGDELASTPKMNKADVTDSYKEGIYNHYVELTKRRLENIEKINESYNIIHNYRKYLDKLGWLDILFGRFETLK